MTANDDLIAELFGDDLESLDGEQVGCADITEHDVVKGLFLWKGALEKDVQLLLHEHVTTQFTFNHEQNQVMLFGTLPAYLDPLLDRAAVILPESLRQQRHIDNNNTLFDQLIANHYQPGQGIRDHIDLDRFEDGIVIASFGSSVVMNFRPYYGTGSGYGVYEGISTTTKVQILLEPGDLVCLSGDGRHKWTHGIEEQDYDIWHGVRIKREERLSLTLRKVKTQGWDLSTPLE